MTRRQFGALLAQAPLLPGAARLLSGQGMATRNLPPRPRGKPSGIPFLAHFTDIAAQAGLRAPVICGDSNKPAVNIIETVGCGVAFFDYDNDGWLDIFMLSGTRLEGPPPGTGNRASIKNNRDGTFTDVTKRQAWTARSTYSRRIIRAIPTSSTGMTARAISTI